MSRPDDVLPASGFMRETPTVRVGIVLKGYPRLSETFVARELLGLQERGLDFLIISLRRPTDTIRHDLNDRIAAPVLYLPEYLRNEPRRVLRGLSKVARQQGFGRALATWLNDLRRDLTLSRIRRFGQAAVLAHEAGPEIDHLYAHFLHTPTSVARYAALMSGLPFSISAHAKDVWTIPDWEIREKLASARWTVTCTAANAAHLEARAPEADVELLYHGVDSARFRRGGRHRAEGPVTVVTVARCVPKKGLGTLLDALAALLREQVWRFVHVGDGPLRAALEERCRTLGLSDRVEWRGALTQLELIPVLEQADIFCLPSQVAADGDRDGLPNVLLEAMSMELPVVSTELPAVTELVEHGLSGMLVPPDDAPALAQALGALMRDPALRQRLGRAGRVRVVQEFSEGTGLDRLADRFGLRRLAARAA